MDKFAQQLLKCFDAIDSSSCESDKFDDFGVGIARGVRPLKTELEQKLAMRDIRDIVSKVKFSNRVISTSSSSA